MHTTQPHWAAPTSIAVSYQQRTNQSSQLSTWSKCHS